MQLRAKRRLVGFSGLRQTFVKSSFPPPNRPKLGVRMAWYVVSYDLRGNESEEAYQRIFAALETAVDWCRPLFSHWVVETPLTPTQIINVLLSVGAIDDDDGVVVL
jgi:hypothetical protein